MNTATYVWKADDYPSINFGEWEAEHWLGHQVKFKLKNQWLMGEVVETERLHLANGIHDILTVEVWDGDSQIKIQAHRQKFKRVYRGE